MKDRIVSELKERVPELRTLVELKKEELGIVLTGMDLDGTICDTSCVFEAGIDGAIQILSPNSLSRREIAELRQLTINHIEKLRNVYIVNPEIMEVAILARASGMGYQDFNNERVIAAIERVRDIYRKDVPEIYSGAREILQIFKPLIITHARRDWTGIKVEGLGIENFISGVECLNVDREKDEQIEQLLKEKGVKPENFMMIGDNFRADIWRVAACLGGYAIFVDMNGKINEIFNRLCQQDKKLFADLVNKGKLSVVYHISRVHEGFLSLKKN